MVGMTPVDFAKKWSDSELKERSGSQTHFNDLCAMLGVKNPTDADPTGTVYTFEAGLKQTNLRQGWADVWHKGYFAWEYKGKHKDLHAARSQLLNYVGALANPPLLVVCDMETFIVYTNFTNTVTATYTFNLDDIAHNRTVGPPDKPLPTLDVLRAVLTDPERLRPEQTTEEVTRLAAAEFATLAESLRKWGHDDLQIARFLMRVLFCLFAEDIELLPPNLFTNLIKDAGGDLKFLNTELQKLLDVMATGGGWGGKKVRQFNGGLFKNEKDGEKLAIDLHDTQLKVLRRAADLNWANIEPSIFGTLFERSFDPAKRKQLGAHYTSRADILLIVEPVIMQPLYRRWQAVQQAALPVIAERDDSSRSTSDRNKATLKANKLINDFLSELGEVRVLDPACGSGNFLYVALRALLDLEKEINVFATNYGISRMLQGINVNPSQFFGIEKDSYAHELASIVIWIGYIQWRRSNGYPLDADPVLENLSGNIRHSDAILEYNSNGEPVEPQWPPANFIVGNPPFLGNKKMLSELGESYVQDLRGLYKGRVPQSAELVAYWFEKARQQIAINTSKRAGLLSTQTIRMTGSRGVLERIKESGNIFMAWSDRPWILDGASVRVSMVGFDDGTEQECMLDGLTVPAINTNLTSAFDITKAKRLSENTKLSFQGVVKVGPFEIDAKLAKTMLADKTNINGRPNSDVVRPSINGSDVVNNSRDEWTIDFGATMSEEDASSYKMPFDYIRQHVRPYREQSRSNSRGLPWWLHLWPRPAMRKALEGKDRFIVTPAVSKYRVFVWLNKQALPDHRLAVFARDDDYFFGVLHSRVHEVWSLNTSSRHGVGNDPTYNNTTCFETFPFPYPPGSEPTADPLVGEIAEAARELVRQRDEWLHAPDLSAAELKKRTLTNLYNEQPDWLRAAHARLDAAVLAAYGWPTDLSDSDILGRLLKLNEQRAAQQTKRT